MSGGSQPERTIAARAVVLGSNDPSAGRRVSLLLPSGVLSVSWLVSRSSTRLLPATLTGWPSVAPAPGEHTRPGESVCYQAGWEVIADVVDGDTLSVLFDTEGLPTWQPSDRGTGGFTIHRQLDKAARMRLVLVETRATLFLPMDAPVTARLQLLQLEKGEVRRG